MSLGHEIGNLIEGANDEIDELHFADGAQAAVAHPASRADNGALADGRVDHALPTKALQQPFAGLECPAVHAHVFADQHDGRVPLISSNMACLIASRNVTEVPFDAPPLVPGMAISAPFSKRR